MKKITLYIILVSLAIVYTGCSKATDSFSEIVPNENQAESTAIFHASIESAFVSYNSANNPENHIFFSDTWRTSGSALEPAEEPQEQPQIMQSSEIDQSSPMLAITFDDGPGEYTAQILDILERHGARATFCIIGNLAESKRGLIARAFEAGCEIIGHSWSHRSLTRLAAQEIKREILDTHAAIESITGAATQIYRVPYGAINDRVKQVSQELGFPIISWSVDPRDWEVKDADLVYDLIIDSADDGAIIICHDTYESTAEAMERVIPDLIINGYQLVTVSELMEYSGITLEPGVVYTSGEKKE